MGNEDLRGPDAYWAMENSRLERAQAEIQRRVQSGALTLPDNPTNALRLLHEYHVAADSGFRRVLFNPDGYAQSLHTFAFDPRFKPDTDWPYTQEQMRAEFIQSGLTGAMHERLPISYAVAMLLIGPEQYRQTLVDFRPTLAQMRLTERAQARLHTQVIKHPGSRQMPVHSVQATVTLTGGATDGTGSSVSVSSSNGIAQTTLVHNGITLQSIYADPGGQTEPAAQTRMEEEAAILYDGSVTRTSTRHTQDGIEVQRAVQLSKKYVSSKALEELAAGQLFMAAYNAANHTEHTIYNSPDDTDKDLIAGDLKIQVIKCADGKVWGALAARSTYTDTLDEQQAVAEVIAAVQKKAAHYGQKSSLILLVDGGWTGFTGEIMRAVTRQQQAILAASGFPEIWYVSRVANSATRLYPV